VSGSALLTLQGAVRSALEADTALMTLVSAVHEAVPASPVYPFVLLGEKSESSLDTFSGGGATGAILLDIRSRAADDQELLQIYDRVKAALHGRPLTLTGYTLVSGRATLVKTVLDADGLTRRAEARYEAVTQEAAE
jgi:hypothetical protein